MFLTLLTVYFHPYKMDVNSEACRFSNHAHTQLSKWYSVFIRTEKLEVRAWDSSPVPLTRGRCLIQWAMTAYTCTNFHIPFHLIYMQKFVKLNSHCVLLLLKKWKRNRHPIGKLPAVTVPDWGTSLQRAPSPGPLPSVCGPWSNRRKLLHTLGRRFSLPDCLFTWMSEQF